jgi:hypothetical protein
MPNKILELTKPQQDYIKVVYQIFYDAALQTETNETTCANAEKAVGRLVGSALLPDYLVSWVENPEKGERLYQQKMQQVLGNLRISDSMYESLGHDFRTAATDHVLTGYRSVFDDLVHELVSPNCDFDVHRGLNIALSRNLLSIVDNSVALSSTMLSIPRDLPWVAECSYWARILESGVGVDRAIWITELTNLFEAAHALWVLPGEVIICMKPIQVTTDSEGKIITMHWKQGYPVYVAPTANYEDPQPGDVTVYNQ